MEDDDDDDKCAYISSGENRYFIYFHQEGKIM